MFRVRDLRRRELRANPSTDRTLQMDVMKEMDARHYAVKNGEDCMSRVGWYDAACASSVKVLQVKVKSAILTAHRPGIEERQPSP